MQLEPLHVNPHEFGFHLEPARFLTGDDVKNHIPEPEGKELLTTKRGFTALSATKEQVTHPPQPLWYTQGQTHSPKPAPSKPQLSHVLLVIPETTHPILEGMMVGPRAPSSRAIFLYLPKLCAAIAHPMDQGLRTG